MWCGLVEAALGWCQEMVYSFPLGPLALTPVFLVLSLLKLFKKILIL